jgi:lipopolysaccharide/colanic/teichoic acid biosynthesis glycosyltransferase
MPLTLSSQIPRRKLFWKFLLDKGVAAVASVPGAPLMGLAALCIKVEGALDAGARGSILVREKRVSEGTVFDIFKFRTECEDGGLTRVGRRLRKWYLDELPQLLNVLKGEMSLVGPRPYPVADYERFVQRGHRAKRLLRAGITEEIQVAKAGPRLGDPELEEEYLLRCQILPGHRIVLYDLRLILRTLPVILKGEGL